MASLPKEVAAFKDKYGVTADEMWLVAGGKQYAIKHPAIERIAIEQGITFDPPTIIQNEAEYVAMVIVAKMGDQKVWTMGEASKENCKVKYLWSMAEKRGKDRAALKLLQVHGIVYGEDEADDFKQPTGKRENPIVNRPADFSDAKPKIDPETGEFIDFPSIPGVAPRPKAGSRELFDALQKELMEIESLVVLKTWRAAARPEAATLPTDWREMLNNSVEEKRNELKAMAEAAE
jgi:hypothetical protein